MRAAETKSREELKELFFEYARTRDRRIRDELVVNHMGLARYLASTFGHRGEPLDDLVQVACVGLLKSVERFDPERGIEFATFASATIVGELKRHFRDHTWSVKVSRRVQELKPRVDVAVAELSQSLGRAPTVREVAERLGVSPEEVLESMEASSAYRPATLDTPAGESGHTDALGEDEIGFEASEMRMTVASLLQELPERERAILYLRFFDGLTQSEIGQRFGISQMQVSRLIAQSLRRLKPHLEDD